MKDIKEMYCIKETITIWLLNIGAWSLALLPLLQFIAVVLAIFVSVTTLIINWNKVKQIFKL